MNQPRGLDTRAKRPEWARQVSPCPKSPPRRDWPKAKVFYGDSTKPGVCDRLDAKPQSQASHKSSLLNEPGLALNVFWLPAGREEGVRRAWTKVRNWQTDPSPGSDVTRWNQMGD